VNSQGYDPPIIAGVAPPRSRHSRYVATPAVNNAGLGAFCRIQQLGGPSGSAATDRNPARRSLGKVLQ